jgi:hypothetical protein
MATKTPTKKPAGQDMIDACFAKAVADGDIVNFRFLFISYSPLRAASLEDIHSPKYDYLRPKDTGNVLYKNALELVGRGDMRAHITKQLEKQGPAQLPAPLLMMLADNAVRLGKYTAAAQAYELLRVRRRMREEYLDGADEALGKGDIRTAVRGYLIGAGLDYDYAAFPEPLPQVPDYQAKALVLHADYPEKPEDSIALQQPEQHLRIALDFLLIDPELSARLNDVAFETRLAFLVELVRQQDPNWGEFAKRFKDTCTLVIEHAKALEQQKNAGALAQEVEQIQSEWKPEEIPSRLLGRVITDGEWWQYIKELAYEHPASILFVARQALSPSVEIVLPRYLHGSPLPGALGLL